MTYAHVGYVIKFLWGQRRPPGDSEIEQLINFTKISHSIPTYFNSICDALKQIQPRSADIEVLEISSDRDSCGSDLPLRCGRPFEQTFHDVGRLYLRYLYKDYRDAQQKRYIIFFIVKRDIFYTFFGSPGDGDYYMDDVEPEALLLTLAGSCNASEPYT